MNHNKKNDKISNGGKSGKYRHSEPSTLLQGSCTFVVFDISRTDIECRARDGVRRQHTSSYAQDAWHRRIFFSCTRDQRTCVGSTPNGQGHVDCLSPLAQQKSLIRSMFRGTLLESQFSSPNPFSSFCSTPPPTQTSLLNTGMSMTPCVTPKGGLLFGRMAGQSPLTKPSLGQP